jgi:phage major head subunit gpT-like protein
MILTPSNLQFFFTSLNTVIRQAYDSAQPFWPQVATLFPSATEQQVYGWLGRIDKMREWIGSRKTNPAAPFTYTLVNRPYELTVGIDKFKLQDDTYGIYYPIVADLGLQAKKWPDYQLRDLLLNQGTQTGQRQIGLDGLTHWNTAHPVDPNDPSKGTYCNDFTGGGVVINGKLVGGALSPVSLGTVFEEMVSRKGEDGEPLGVMPDTLLIPPQLKTTAETLVNSSFFAPPAIGNLTGQVGPVDNPYQRFGFKIVVAPELAAQPNVWYLLDCSKAVKPFVFQQRQAPNFVYRIQEQDPAVFDSHTYIYGVDARGAVGWSHPWLSSRSGP